MTARALPLYSLVVALGLLPSCFDDYSVKTEFASGFARAQHRVSVLGVFKDGRMSTDAWESIAPALSKAFGKKCDAGYGESFTLDHAGLAAAIDDVARAQGVSDDLLGQIAPAAAGDVIVVFTVAGHVEKARHTGSAEGNAAAPSMGPGRGGGAGMMGGGAHSSARDREGSGPTAELDLSATMFSMQSHSTVGVVELAYTGENAADAIARFADQVSKAMPGSTCEGWNWAAPIDEHRVRDLIER